MKRVLFLVLEKFSAPPFRKEKNHKCNLWQGNMLHTYTFFFLQHLPSGNVILICISKAAPIGFDYVSKNT